MEDKTYFCGHCGNPLSGDVKFCGKCGNEVSRPVAKEETSNTVEQPAVETAESVQPIVEIPESQEPVVEVTETVEPVKTEENTQKPIENIYSNTAPTNTTNIKSQPAKAKPKKKGFKLKVWLPIIISIVLIVVIVLFVLLNPWFGTLKSNKTQGEEAERIIPQYFLYMRDDEICGYSIDDSERFDVSSNLGVDEEYSSRYLFYANNASAINDDATLLFYRDNCSEEYSDLYCKRLDVSEDEEIESIIKIDSDVVVFAITNDGKYVYYIKSGDFNLYKSDLENKEKIASNVKNFCINSDASRLIFTDVEGDIFCRTNNENNLVDRDSEIFKVSEDLSAIYYLKDESVYKKVIDKEKEKLASDVEEIININSDDSVYYIKSYEETIKYINYIDKDVNFDGYIDPDYMVEPDWDDYFDDDYYYDIDDYEKADEYYEEASDKYDQAYEEYEAEYERNRELEYYSEFLDELEEETESFTRYALYYSKDNKEEKICENYSYDYAQFDNMLFYYAYDVSDISKISLTSAYESGIEDTMSDIYNEFYKNSDSYYLYKNTVGELDFKHISSVDYDKNNELYYFISYDVEYDEAKEQYNYKDYELYKIEIKDDKVKAPALVYEDVYNVMLVDGFDGIFTLRNRSEKSNLAELYYNDKVIDYDVEYSTIQYDSVSNSIYYCSNYDNSTGTLNMYDGENKTKIADDVGYYIVYDKDKIYYVSDFSSKTNEGSLYYYNGKEKKVIDQDSVGSILKCLDNQSNLDYLVNNIDSSYYYEEDYEDYDDYDDYDY